MNVFISYASEDYEIAKKLYDDLKQADISPWLDREELLVGQNWRDEIPRIIKKSDYFLLLISSHSLSKKGFVQKEQKIALDLLDEFPDNEIFIIPIRLDNTEPANETLQNLHWADFSTSYEKGLQQVLRTLSQKKEGGTDSPKPVSNGAKPFTNKSELLHSEEPKHRNQRTVSIGKDAEDNVIIAGDHVTVNINKTETPPMPPKKEAESEIVSEKKSVSRNKKILMITGIAILCAVLLAGGIYLYFAMSEVPDISGTWKYDVPKDERIWILDQKGRDITIREDSGNECSGKVGKSDFSFSCTEPMTSGAEPVRLTGSGKINPARNKIEGRWEREGLEGSFVMEKVN